MVGSVVANNATNYHYINGSSLNSFAENTTIGVQFIPRGYLTVTANTGLNTWNTMFDGYRDVQSMSFNSSTTAEQYQNFISKYLTKTNMSLNGTSFNNSNLVVGVSRTDSWKAGYYYFSQYPNTGTVAKVLVGYINATQASNLNAGTNVTVTGSVYSISLY